jgi:hypothetical protein
MKKKPVITYLTSKETDLYHQLDERDDQIAALTARLVERDAEVAALQAERHELCQFLIEWDGQDSFREPDYRDQLEERYLNWISRGKDVLSDAIEAAVPAPPTAAPRAAEQRGAYDAMLACFAHWDACDDCQDGDGACEEMFRLWGGAKDALRAARGEASDD